jgi:hypothetical protein
MYLTSLSPLYICIIDCVKKELGSETPKCVFNRGSPRDLRCWL